MGDHGLAERIFGEDGYALGLRLTWSELATLRALTTETWLGVLGRATPERVGEFSERGMDRYHDLAHLVDHGSLWTTKARSYGAEAVEVISHFSIFDMFRQEFGECRVSTRMPPYGDLGRPRMYWRLVRPGTDADTGPMHADHWFDAVIGDPDSIPPDVVQVKVWIAIYCEPGITGMRGVPGSHRREWRFRTKHKDGAIKPDFDENLIDMPVVVFDTHPGDAILFGYDFVHGGFNSAEARRTRVSMEFTLQIALENVRQCVNAI